METPEGFERCFNIFAPHADAMSAEETGIFPAVKRSAKHIAQYDAAREQFNTYFKKRGIAHVDSTDALKSYDRTVTLPH